MDKPLVPQPDPRTQAEKFADLARELECDESEEKFDERLGALAKLSLAAKRDPGV